MSAKHSYEHGQEFPYDHYDNGRRRKVKTWAHKTARAILADLLDRRSIKWGFNDIDQETRFEIVDSMAEIIEYSKGNPDL